MIGIYVVPWYNPRPFAFGFNKVLMNVKDLFWSAIYIYILGQLYLDCPVSNVYLYTLSMRSNYQLISTNLLDLFELKNISQPKRETVL
jgi:hypothetical protein